jgi:hypothetical protein
MPCTVPKKERTEYVQNLVLDFFQEMVGESTTVTLDTSLGKWGLGHTPTKRKLYFNPIAERLALKGCEMNTLKPNDFADVKRRTIGDIADMVEKDLV